MHIWKYLDTWNQVNIGNYIVRVCEINPKGIQFKYLDFSETRAHFYTKKYQAKGP